MRATYVPARADGRQEPRPLLVLLHGGGYTRQYFQVCGADLVDRAAGAGFDVLAVDRPGYGASPALARGPELLARNARALLDDVAGVVQSHAAPSVVLVGHSIGGAIALLMAAERPRWLKGVAVSGVASAPAMSLARRVRWIQEVVPRVPTPRSAKAKLMFGPVGTYDPELAARSMSQADAPALTRELVEIAYWWPAQLTRVGAAVQVPVHSRLGEFDALWPSAESQMKSFGAIFTSAPAVSAQVWQGSGHCIDHHLTNEKFHREQLAFARQCAGIQ